MNECVLTFYFSEFTKHVIKIKCKDNNLSIFCSIIFLDFVFIDFIVYTCFLRSMNFRIVNSLNLY